MNENNLSLSTAFINPIITPVNEEITSRGIPGTIKHVKPTFN